MSGLIKRNFRHLTMPVFILLYKSMVRSVVKVVLWSRGGLTWRSQVGENPIPIPTHGPTNLALFRHKITFYRFNQGGSYYCRGGGVQMGAGGWAPPHSPPLTLTTGFDHTLTTAVLFGHHIEKGILKHWKRYRKEQRSFCQHWRTFHVMKDKACNPHTALQTY